MCQALLRIRNQPVTQYARVTQGTDSLVIQFRGLLSPNTVRRIIRLLKKEYRSRYASNNIIFDCYKEEGDLHIRLKRKPVAATYLGLAESVTLQ